MTTYRMIVVMAIIQPMGQSWKPHFWPPSCCDTKKSIFQEVSLLKTNCTRFEQKPQRKQKRRWRASVLYPIKLLAGVTRLYLCYQLCLSPILAPFVWYEVRSVGLSSLLKARAVITSMSIIDLLNQRPLVRRMVKNLGKIMVLLWVIDFQALMTEKVDVQRKIKVQ